MLIGRRSSLPYKETIQKDQREGKNMVGMSFERVCAGCPEELTCLYQVTMVSLLDVFRSTLNRQLKSAGLEVQVDLMLRLTSCARRDKLCTQQKNS